MDRLRTGRRYLAIPTLQTCEVLTAGGRGMFIFSGHANISASKHRA